MRSYSTAWTASSAQRGERRTREDCHKGERRSGQRGKRSREYDRSTKSDRQIASTTKPRLRQCVTARQRPHFPLYKSQQQERCRRKAALKFLNFRTNRYICKRKISPTKKSHLRNKKQPICGNIWGINLGNVAYIFVYQSITMLQPISTGL